MNKDEIVYLSFAYERWCDEKVDKFDLLQKTKQEKKKNTCWPILGYNSHHELSQLLVLTEPRGKSWAAAGIYSHVTDWIMLQVF